MKRRVAILIRRGSNMAPLIRARLMFPSRDRGRSPNRRCRALQKARPGHPDRVNREQTGRQRSRGVRAVLQAALDQHGLSFEFCLGGFMRLSPEFVERCTEGCQHPSLVLPSFPASSPRTGMRAGVKISGATVHL